MRAAILKAFGSPLAIEALPDPELGTGEVIVDVPPRTVAHDGPVYDRPYARPAWQDALQADAPMHLDRVDLAAGGRGQQEQRRGQRLAVVAEEERDRLERGLAGDMFALAADVHRAAAQQGVQGLPATGLFSNSTFST